MDQAKPSSGEPRFIVVEGPIGVGKTTLARRLARTFGCETLLEEPEENPFLGRFYGNMRSGALQTQLFFLFQRARQLEQLRQTDLFLPVRVSDFLMEKDRLFARLTLDEAELKLYEQVYAHLTIDAPAPDLVVYLQAPVDVLMARIARRGRPCEQGITRDYVAQVAEAYMQSFHHFTASPLLIVNASGIDLAENEADYELLLQRIRSITSGRHYFNPVPPGF